jgi:hypothetical protein
VRLDVPVSVQTTEALTDELRFAFEDATLHAFDEVIDASIRHDVDFLLLSGNVFIEADRSLRARLALLKGVRRLAEHDIQVFVLPGDSDPPEAWRGIPEMPDNLVVCYSSNPEPEELYVKDRLATTISSSIWFGEADAFGIQVIAKDTDGIQPFRIGVVSKSKYEESRRMAAMAASASDETLSASVSNLTSGEQLTESDSVNPTSSLLGSGVRLMLNRASCRANWIPVGGVSSGPWRHSNPGRRMPIHRWIRVSYDTSMKCCMREN